VYAFSRQSGKQEWMTLPLSHQYLLLEQLSDMPVLLFTSQFNKSSSQGNLERQGVHITGVSKANGKLIYDNPEMVQTAAFHSLSHKPSDGRIELTRQDLKIILQAKQ